MRIERHHNVDIIRTPTAVAAAGKHTEVPRPVKINLHSCKHNIG